MKYILQFGIIIGISFVGEALGELIPLAVPAGIYGMVIMFLCLAFGIIKPEWIEKTAEFLDVMMDSVRDSLRDMVFAGELLTEEVINSIT